MNVRYKAQHIIVVGGLELEGNTMSAKLICSRMQQMLCKGISDSEAEALFSNIIPFCGKNGMEVQRVSGTNGLVNDQSTRDILSLLAKDNKLLPNKAGACLILPGEKQYWIFYKRHKKKIGRSPIAMYKYSPPQTGGAIKLHPNVLDVFPVIREFEYVKMISVLLLHEINERETFLSGKPISRNAVACELASISYARKIFHLTESYSAMCKNYLACNSMSVVAWPVWQHHDHFHKHGEAIENKMLFVIKSISNRLGRGGSLKKEFVFGLLDWSYQTRSARDFYTANAVAIGLGQPEPRHAEQRLAGYFELGGDTGSRWRNLYNDFMQSRNS